MVCGLFVIVVLHIKSDGNLLGRLAVDWRFRADQLLFLEDYSKAIFSSQSGAVAKQHWGRIPLIHCCDGFHFSNWPQPGLGTWL